MTKLNEKKRKWVITQFRSGRSATSIARIQRISRQWAYSLMNQYKQKGIKSYALKKAGRPKLPINPKFAGKVTELRKTTDYGSEKLHFVLRRTGFSVLQRQIQRVLDEYELTESCEKKKRTKKVCKVLLANIKLYVAL